MKQQIKQHSTIYDDLKSKFGEKSTQGLTQSEYDMEQKEENIRYEE